MFNNQSKWLFCHTLFIRISTQFLSSQSGLKTLNVWDCNIEQLYPPSRDWIDQVIYDLVLGFLFFV